VRLIDLPQRLAESRQVVKLPRRLRRSNPLLRSESNGIFGFGT
jgi:hypothetical protein